MEITKTVASEDDLTSTLIALSQEYNGAWVFSIKPFSHEVTFIRFKSPSKVPDHYLDLTRNTMAYKGKIREFTKAARSREQNRGLGSR